MVTAAPLAGWVGEWATWRICGGALLLVTEFCAPGVGGAERHDPPRSLSSPSWISCIDQSLSPTVGHGKPAPYVTLSTTAKFASTNSTVSPSLARLPVHGPNAVAPK